VMGMKAPPGLRRENVPILLPQPRKRKADLAWKGSGPSVDITFRG
jgi:hypothetical protein